MKKYIEFVKNIIISVGNIHYKKIFVFVSTFSFLREALIFVSINLLVT